MSGCSRLSFINMHLKYAADCIATRVRKHHDITIQSCSILLTSIQLHTIIASLFTSAFSTPGHWSTCTFSTGPHNRARCCTVCCTSRTTCAGRWCPCRATAWPPRSCARSSRRHRWWATDRTGISWSTSHPLSPQCERYPRDDAAWKSDRRRDDGGGHRPSRWPQPVSPDRRACWSVSGGQEWMVIFRSSSQMNHSLTAAAIVLHTATKQISAIISMRLCCSGRSRCCLNVRRSQTGSENRL